MPDQMKARLSDLRQKLLEKQHRATMLAARSTGWKLAPLAKARFGMYAGAPSNFGLPMKTTLHNAIFVITTILLYPAASRAHAADDGWETAVRTFDADYWRAFNDCEVRKLAAMNTDDLEFYHDRGGLEKGRQLFEKSVAANICSNPDRRVRREAVADSLRYYPLRDGAKLYGAIVSGEHLFYRRTTSGPEQLTGRARFTHTLLLEGGQWKVARVLSFDHGAASRDVAPSGGKKTD